MQEELDDQFVHRGTFGKGKGLANESPRALAQGTIETFDVVGETPLGKIGLVLSGGKHVVIALQVVGLEKPLAAPSGICVQSKQAVASPARAYQPTGDNSEKS